MSSLLTKFKNIDKFFKLFGGYDYDDCCCGGSCGCCGGSHDNFSALTAEKNIAVENNINLFGGYDYEDCCCGGSCGCCGSGHNYIADKNSSSFAINTKRADVPLA